MHSFYSLSRYFLHEAEKIKSTTTKENGHHAGKTNNLKNIIMNGNIIQELRERTLMMFNQRHQLIPTEVHESLQTSLIDRVYVEEFDRSWLPYHFDACMSPYHLHVV